MSARWQIFVEGDSDRKFLLYLMKHIDLTGVDIEVIGGGVSHLQRIEPVIRRSHDAGNQIAILLDADQQPSERRQQFQKQRDILRLPIMDDDCFLMPTDSDPGALETLLEHIAVNDHRVVYGCFQQYEDCLQNRSESYHLPNSKARIFAYCEALNIETHPNRRDYGDSLYWNLDAPILNPLKDFLLGLNANGR